MDADILNILRFQLIFIFGIIFSYIFTNVSKINLINCIIYTLLYALIYISFCAIVNALVFDYNNSENILISTLFFSIGAFIHIFLESLSTKKQKK